MHIQINNGKIFGNYTDSNTFRNDKRFRTNASRAKNIDALYTIVAEILLNKTTSNWLQILNKAEIPSGAVNTLNDLNKDPHLVATDFFRNFNHPTEGAMRIPDTAFQLNKKSLPIRHPQPRLGEHSKEILREAGIEKHNIDKILKNKPTY